MKLKTVVALVSLALLAGCANTRPRIEGETVQNYARDAISSHVEYPLRQTGVLIMGKEHSFRLDALESFAQSFLRKNDPSFPGTGTQSMSLSVIINAKVDEFLHLQYSGGFGEPYWVVTIDNRGKLAKWEKGILTD